MNYWATIEHVARISRVPERTIRRWVEEGRLTSRGHRPRQVNLREVEDLRGTLRRE